MVCYCSVGVIAGTWRTKYNTILTTCAYFCIGASVTWLACGNYRRLLSLVSSLLTTHRPGPKRGKIDLVSVRRNSRRFAWDGASAKNPEAPEDYYRPDAPEPLPSENGPITRVRIYPPTRQEQLDFLASMTFVGMRAPACACCR